MSALWMEFIEVEEAYSSQASFLDGT